MTHEKVLPIIMAGGSGERLWPLSRAHYPKQFLSLTGNEHTMLQQTLLRLQGIEHQPPLIICNEAHRFIAAEQVRQLNTPHSGILLEPEGKNTAPAIALAAFTAMQKGSDPLLLVLAADHAIKNVCAFQTVVKSALKHAARDKLVTFGIVADKPKTGFGYIKQGAPIDGGFVIEQFIEKPNKSLAEQLISSGDYCWNSGMFLFRASCYLNALKNYRPDIYDACEKAMYIHNHDLDFIRVDQSAFLSCPPDSIDYAVMEKADNAVVIPMDAGWSDLGSFEALWQDADKDRNNNALLGDVIVNNTSGSLIQSDGVLVTTIGVKDLVVVATQDAVLVADKQYASNVKNIVERLKQQGRQEVTDHREVYRPWGKYDLIDVGERFQVKRITVKPGAKLSKQMHHHRAEHWVVVSGTAKVIIDDVTQYLTENESVYIPITAVHSLENPGKVALELIEVQSGGYLGEDDIIRYEDKYNRS
ncbi:mannose-1-phosphate guanylyltransferase/mannose-6-phosphate isomerase [Pseudoalteromonas aurantia]|uniref:mannose-1-phosphate guanylyltransferase/mannose-6-phosphate isomerase n=1 Tax=Pseudoalteromonas aurantia TaxID=43654 RepID=UPI00110BBAB4|nr:mannose-1-phosphate guanylyltransferase/mannose-6-phosphate isomerase [Pseudoalteromonas aurantia]TMO67136.1 mannose-1-phosphate guanylyltransferase/mannose-6-phosphate isomerase [Pseudoalteromonas aurantia]